MALALTALGDVAWVGLAEGRIVALQVVRIGDPASGLLLTCVPENNKGVWSVCDRSGEPAALGL